VIAVRIEPRPWNVYVLITSHLHSCFIPADGGVRPVGWVRAATIPMAELAVVLDHSPHDDVDLGHSALVDYR